jgi:hypothetical protein
MTVTLYHMHILYIYTTHNINCHDRTVIRFAKTLEFIIKLAWVLFVLIITKSLTYPFLFMFFPHHYVYMRGLAILREDATEANLGDNTRPNSCDF